jgi:hypothetical protein
MSAPNTTGDYYEVLEVSPSASPEVIEAAYKGLSRKYGEHADPNVREQRRFLDEAYGVIGNVQKRAEYDRSRNGSAPAQAAVAVSAEPAPVRLGGAQVVQCARDPEVETALRCSRCDAPICPKCLVQTPVGARCKDCARIAKSPVYTVQGATLWRAIAGAGVGGVGMGLIWGFISVSVVGVGGLFMSALLGVGLGYGFTRLMEFATGRKRGPVVSGLAMGGIVLATAIQMLMVSNAYGGGIFVSSLIAGGIGLYFARQNLR